MVAGPRREVPLITHDPCPLTPQERAAYRDWQVREILRRRDAKRKASLAAAASAAVEALESRAAAGVRASCPDCGRPYGVRARCYSCRPGGRPRKGP